MKVTAKELLELGIIDHVIAEPEPASSANLIELCGSMRAQIRRFLYENLGKEAETLALERYDRFRKM